MGVVLGTPNTHLTLTCKQSESDDYTFTASVASQRSPRSPLDGASVNMARVCGFKHKSPPEVFVLRSDVTIHTGSLSSVLCLPLLFDRSVFTHSLVPSDGHTVFDLFPHC